MNMWEAIKNFCFTDSTKAIARGEAALIELEKRYGEAIHYYCGICKRGFKTRGAKSSHTKLKHKLSTQSGNTVENVPNTTLYTPSQTGE